MAIIPNDELRTNFLKTKAGLMPMLSAYSYEAALAAYRDGAVWHEELLVYLRQNHQFLLNEVNQLKGMKMMPLEATYLAWIDTRETGIENFAQKLEEVGVGVSDGIQFDGEGFIRLNFACPRTTLEQVIRRIKSLF